MTILGGIFVLDFWRFFIGEIGFSFRHYVEANGPLTSYLTGHNGNDKLVGTDAGEYLDGSAGNDSITAMGGNDSIFGGLGNDTMDAGDGDDYVRDEFGNSVVFGGAGNDKIQTGDGNDSLVGGDGDDEFQSGRGSDTFDGGNGNDYIFSKGGKGTHSSFIGGAGDDFISLDNIENEVYGNVGTVFADGGDGDDDIIILGSGNATLIGGSGNDFLKTDGADALLDGGTGDDKLDGGNDAQTFIFNKGYGFDTIEGWSSGAPHNGAGLQSVDVVQLGNLISASDFDLDIATHRILVNYEDGNLWEFTRFDLNLSIRGTNDTLKIEDYLTKTPEVRGLIMFADGTSWSHADVLSKVSADVDVIEYWDSLASLVATPAAHSADLFGV